MPTLNIRNLLLFSVLLLPSAWFAWRNRSMPQLGRAHDDAIYLTVSKSLAQGSGYRVQNLPGSPVETKYPPMVIWLLAPMWWLNPQFPQNLPIASAIQWAMIPPFLFFTGLWLRRLGLSPPLVWVCLGLIAVSPYTVSFGAGIYTEVLFGAFLLGSLLACERSIEGGWWWAALGGVLAGLAYWTRTAGIVALVSAPAIFLLRRRFRQAAAYFAAMAPFVAGWIVWVKLYRAVPDDTAMLYNTDYVGFFLKELHISDLPTLVWENQSRLFYAIGSFPFPLEYDSMLLVMLRFAAAAGILHGLWQHRGNRALWFYFVFAGLTAVELVVWNFPPNLRLMYPLVPLFAAGLAFEGQHIAALTRSARQHRDKSQRIAASLVTGAVGLLVVLGGWMQAEMSFAQLPVQADQQAQVRAESEAAFAWIAAHSDLSANVLCLNPALYLYTGRRTESIFPLPIYWYRKDAEGTLRAIRNVPDRESNHSMDYLYLHDGDYDAFAPEHAEDARKLLAANPELKVVYQGSRGVIYKLPQTRLASAP